MSRNSGNLLTALEIMMEEEGDRQISALKREIQQQHGAAVFSQQIFLLAQGGQEASLHYLTRPYFQGPAQLRCTSMLHQVTNDFTCTVGFFLFVLSIAPISYLFFFAIVVPLNLFSSWCL